MMKIQHLRLITKNIILRHFTCHILFLVDKRLHQVYVATSRHKTSQILHVIFFLIFHVDHNAEQQKSFFQFFQHVRNDTHIYTIKHIHTQFANIAIGYKPLYMTNILISYNTTNEGNEPCVVRVSHDTKTFSSITYALIIINLMYEKYSCYQIIMRITSNACTTIGIQISYTLII